MLISLHALSQWSIGLQGNTFLPGLIMISRILSNVQQALQYYVPDPDTKESHFNGSHYYIPDSTTTSSFKLYHTGDLAIMKKNTVKNVRPYSSEINLSCVC
jgi:hypothetical protein